VASLDYTLSAESSRINPVLPLILPGDGQTADDTGLETPLSNVDEIRDPLLRFPFQTGGSIIGAGALSLALIGLGKLADPARSTEDVTELVISNQATIGKGDLDTDHVDELLKTGPERTQFDVVGERDEFTLYGSGPEIDAFVAVSETSVVVADSRKQVTAVLDARYGDRTHIGAGDNTFASLLNTTNSGHVQVGWEPPIDLDQHTIVADDDASPSSVISTDDSVVSSVSFHPGDNEVTADLTLDAADRVAPTPVENQLGAASSERSLSIENYRVAASATYPASRLALEFVAE
jgi:hypothetical protein